MRVRLKFGGLRCLDVDGREVALRSGDIADLPLDNPALARLVKQGAFERVISTGDRFADKIAHLLEAAGPRGLTREALRDRLQRNYSSARIKAALDLLVEHELARGETTDTRGRPRHTWRLVEGCVTLE